MTSTSSSSPELMQQVTDDDVVSAAATPSTAGSADADGCQSGSASTEPAAPAVGEWPPSDWKQQKPPRTAMLCITNVLPHRLARVRTPESATENDPNAAEITSLFASDRSYAARFDPKTVRTDEFACHAVPDCPFPKTLFMHIETLRAIQELRTKYGTCGLEFHRAPHPKLRGVWWIERIYVYPGTAILAEMHTTRPCARCKQTTAWLPCYCETVEFCSRTCQDRAIIEGTHTMLDCREAHARKVTENALRARNRMIRFREDLEKDEALSRQITVQQQERRAQLEEDVERSKVNAAEYLRARKARLQAESARTRAEKGMEPDPSIPDELQVGGAQHAAALLGPGGGQNPPNIPPPRQEAGLDP